MSCAGFSGLLIPQEIGIAAEQGNPRKAKVRTKAPALLPSASSAGFGGAEQEGQRHRQEGDRRAQLEYVHVGKHRSLLV
jgi:hypothetical protein